MNKAKMSFLATLLAGVTLSALSTGAHASDSNYEIKNPQVLADIANYSKEKPPFLQQLLDSGDKVYYIGAHNNFRSYNVESPGGKMMTVNIDMSDGKGVQGVVGVLFDKGGCITCDEYAKLNDRIRAMSSKGTMSEQSRTTDPIPSVARQIEAEPPKPANAPLSLADIRKEQQADDDTSIYLAHSTWDEFSKEADKSAYFDVGDSKAPVLYMIADPHCPYCHRYWTQIKPLVVSGKLRVRIILTRALSGSEPDVHNLLGNPNVGQAWLRGEGSVEGYPITPTVVPGSSAYADTDKAYQYNLQFANKYLEREAPPGNQTGGTPFFAYHGTDGNFYAAEGPGDLDTFLSHVGMK